MADDSYSVKISIPFPSKRLAQIAYDVLIVDAEPKRSSVQKTFNVDDHLLKANFIGSQVKQIRVAITSFFSNIILINETMELCGPPVSSEYSHYLS